MLYRHFESKRELHIRLMERRRDELAAEPLGEFLQAAGTLKQRLAVMVDAWFAHVERHPDTSRLLFQDATGDPRDPQPASGAAPPAALRCMALLREFGGPVQEDELEPLGDWIGSGACSAP